LTEPSPPPLPSPQGEGGDPGGWVAFGTLDEIPRGGARAVKTLFGEIGLFRTRDDRVFALDNLCPHKGARLSMGTLEGDAATGEVVVCPFHAWRFNLADGKCVDMGYGMTCPVPVRVVEGIVQLRLDPPPW